MEASTALESLWRGLPAEVEQHVDGDGDGNGNALEGFLDGLTKARGGLKVQHTLD